MLKQCVTADRNQLMMRDDVNECVFVCVSVAGGLIVPTVCSAAFYNTDIIRSDNFMRLSTHTLICTCTDGRVSVCVRARAATLTHAASALSWAHRVARRGLNLSTS